MPLFNKSYNRRRVAEHRPKASNPQNPPSNQNNRNHQHPGHPTTAPLPWGEGSGRPAGQEGQLSCRRKVQKNELGAGHRGGRGRGPNQANPTTTENNTQHPTTTANRGEDGLHSNRDTVDYEREVNFSLSKLTGKNVQ